MLQVQYILSSQYALQIKISSVSGMLSITLENNLSLLLGSQKKCTVMHLNRSLWSKTGKIIQMCSFYLTYSLNNLYYSCKLSRDMTGLIDHLRTQQPQMHTKLNFPHFFYLSKI